jgi:S1-C subfamily serine protease
LLSFFIQNVNQNQNGNNKKDHNKRHFADCLLFASLIPIVHAKSVDNDDEKDLKKNAVTGHRQNFNFIADVVEKVMPSIVQIQLKTNTLFGPIGAASGSGFIISEDGLIMTNAHVVQNIYHDINIKLNSGKIYRGRVLKIDRSADLALIKIDCVINSNI